jgi:hypothetical protein
VGWGGVGWGGVGWGGVGWGGVGWGGVGWGGWVGGGGFEEGTATTHSQLQDYKHATPPGTPSASPGLQRIAGG